MNRYQEALNKIVSNNCPRKINCRECEISNKCNSLMKCEIDVLQELIDKSTSKRALLVSDYDGFLYECPVCHQDFRPDFLITHIKWTGCPYCLQNLDWSNK